MNKQKGKGQSEIRLLWLIIKKCNFEKVLAAFVICFFVSALIIELNEPGINSYGDALWYCFVACTTIGFGDLLAVSILGRILTVFLTVFELVLVALLSGVVVSHYLEVIHTREKLSATMFMDKLEHLTELDEDELLQIQEKVKSFKTRQTAG